MRSGMSIAVIKANPDWPTFLRGLIAEWWFAMRAVKSSRRDNGRL
jgi:hypothetical protein